jgi:hypothetical protein
MRVSLVAARGTSVGRHSGSAGHDSVSFA